jgi:hypothetical protein
VIDIKKIIAFAKREFLVSSVSAGVRTVK